MGAVQPSQRGAAAGTLATALNSGQTLAISLFFTLLTAGLAARLPASLTHGLRGAGVPASTTAAVAHLPPVATLFATFLGYNPMKVLLGPHLSALPAHAMATVTSTSFFPSVISRPFHDGLRLTFGVAAAMMLLAAFASFSTRPRIRADEVPVTLAGGPAPTPPLAEPLGGAPALAAWARYWRDVAIAAGPSAPLIVTVSSPIGAGGDLIAQQVAARLSIPFVDRAIPVEVAESLGVPVDEAAERDEHVASTARRLLAGAANTEPLFGADAGPAGFDDEDWFRQATEAALWKYGATTGGVVLGRGGSLILSDHPRALHVRFTASDETRIRRLEDYLQLGGSDARRTMARTDAARDLYARHFYGVNFRDPGLYDVVIATDKLQLHDATDLVMASLAAAHIA
jgi:cytidylate kinase